MFDVDTAARIQGRLRRTTGKRTVHVADLFGAKQVSKDNRRHMYRMRLAAVRTRDAPYVGSRIRVGGNQQSGPDKHAGVPPL